MRVLIACEYSGKVREAFTRLGHDAWSCDLLPTDVQGKHIQGDVLPLLQPTNIVEGREQRLHLLPPSKDRWKLRSETYQGIADAMADQWGKL